LEDLAFPNHFLRGVPRVGWAGGPRSMFEHTQIKQHDLIIRAELLRAERNGKEMALKIRVE
jgi:hypothetical protein